MKKGAKAPFLFRSSAAFRGATRSILKLPPLRAR
jgi:hypothetical protein